MQVLSLLLSLHPRHKTTGTGTIPGDGAVRDVSDLGVFGPKTRTLWSLFQMGGQDPGLTSNGSGSDPWTEFVQKSSPGSRKTAPLRGLIQRVGFRALGAWMPGLRGAVCSEQKTVPFAQVTRVAKSQWLKTRSLGIWIAPLSIVRKSVKERLLTS